jgi:hypothetical protein
MPSKNQSKPSTQRTKTERVSSVGLSPRVGDLAIDASELGSFLIDVPPGGLRGKVRSHDGIAEVVHEVQANQRAYGATLGVANSDVEELDVIAERIAAVQKYLPAVAKLNELCEETLAMLENRREVIVRSVADAIDGKTKNKALYSELCSKYESTLTYRGETAKKAAKTRAKTKAQPAPK